jgi:hypothetical protein
MASMALRLLVSILFVIPLIANAEVHPVGEIQQELVSWSGNASNPSGKAISDGGIYSLLHNSNGASWIGLSASENLTHQFQAIAHVSYSIIPDELNNLMGREGWIGFASNLSEWRLGTLFSPYRRSTSEWDPFLGTFMQARGNGAISGLHTTSLKNAIDYRSNWYDIDIDFLYSLDDKDRDGDTSGDRQDSSSLALQWDAERHSFIGSYQDDTVNGNGVGSKLGWRFVGSHWRIVMQHERTRINGDNTQYSYFSSSYTESRSEYAFAFGSQRDNNPANLDLDYLNFGMKYNMSEKAVIHIGYRYSREQAPNDRKETAWGLGLRYRL